MLILHLPGDSGLKKCGVNSLPDHQKPNGEAVRLWKVICLELIMQKRRHCRGNPNRDEQSSWNQPASNIIPCVLRNDPMICSAYHTKCKCLSKFLCSEGGKAGVWEDQMAACLKNSQEQLLAGLVRAEKVFKCIYCSSVTLVHPNGHLTHQMEMWSLFILMMCLNELDIRAPTHLLYHPKHVFPPAAI